MIFTGYIDESDTHGSTPDMTMAAMLSSAGRWQRCERRLRAIQREFSFSIFHGTTFATLNDEFEGWSGQKCYDLLMAFGNLVADHVTECITVSCEHEVYRKHFLDARPAKMHQTSQYGICFLATLDALSKIVAVRGPQHKLSVVIEDGHHNAMDTQRLFDERKGRLEKAGIDFLRSHSLLTKKQCPLLMLADITSHGHALEQRAVRSGGAPHFSERDEREPSRGETGWTIYEVTPAYLTALIGEFNSGRVAAREDYLRRKQASLDAKQAVER
jgi:hypothetical protein